MHEVCLRLGGVFVESKIVFLVYLCAVQKTCMPKGSTDCGLYYLDAACNQSGQFVALMTCVLVLTDTF